MAYDRLWRDRHTQELNQIVNIKKATQDSSLRNVLRSSNEREAAKIESGLRAAE